MKEGIDFYPTQCQMSMDMALVCAKYGLPAMGFLTVLNQRIYGEHGYYCEWNEDIALLLSHNWTAREGIDVTIYVEEFVKRGIFDKEMYEKYHILTSAEIQEIYFSITTRRKKQKAIREYMLIDIDNWQKNVDNFAKNVDIFTQSKVKESKEKQIKANYSKVEQSEVKQSKVNVAPAVAPAAAPDAATYSPYCEEKEKEAVTGAPAVARTMAPDGATYSPYCMDNEKEAVTEAPDDAHTTAPDGATYSPYCEDKEKNNQTIAPEGANPGLSDGLPDNIREYTSREKRVVYPYGKRKNVYLTKEEYEELKRAIPDCDGYIEMFSKKLEKYNFRHIDHYTAIRKWWIQDKEAYNMRKNPQNRDAPKEQRGSFDEDEFYEKALKRALRREEEEKMKNDVAPPA